MTDSSFFIAPRPATLPDDVTTGFIGGTGVYEIEGLEVLGEYNPETPWGFASSPVVVGRYAGQKIAFLARHGRGHHILPSEIPSQANICLLKWLSVKQIISFSAVGSLKEEIAPRDFILPDSVIDRTRQRPGTYFGHGVVGHASFGDPFSPCLEKFIAEVFSENFPDQKLHRGETLICMEGPAFSTRAESKLYKSWGAGIINMSVLPEAKLAREAEIAYQMICMSTDYDSWREHEGVVDAAEIMAVVKDNSRRAGEVIFRVLENLGKLPADCSDSLKGSMKFGIITAPDARGQEQAARLKQLLPEYF